MDESLVRHFWQKRMEKKALVVSEIRALGEKGVSKKEIAKKYGFSEKHVELILSERSPRL